jgi:hypothetical protein
MPDSLHALHLLIPGAGLPAAAGAAATPLPAQALPKLRQLLRHMLPSSLVECDEDSPSMPHELALAQIHGLPAQPGLIPWAAFETGTAGLPCAWITPCHWQAAASQMLLSDPADLRLDEAGSRALLAAAAPYFREDGIELSYRRPDAWLATGEVFRDLPTRSLERVIGCRVSPEVFDAIGSEGAKLRRLQNEIQMLFHMHPANEARQEGGLLPVNAFWIAGAGVLEQPLAPVPGVVVETRLLLSARQQNAQAHALAWADVDADTCALLLAQLRQGQAVRLTLCGDQRARSYSVAPASLLRRIKNVLGLQPPFNVLEKL